MLNKVIKVILIVALIGVVGYCGACIYGNFVNRGDTKSPALPTVDKAAYTVHIENTGNILLTNRYEMVGGVYILHNYWEMVGNQFKYRGRDLVLDQKIFGDITIHRRE